MEQPQVTPPGLVPRTSMTLNDGEDVITTTEGARARAASAAGVTPGNHPSRDTAAAAVGFTRGEHARAGQLLVVEAEEAAEEEEGGVDQGVEYSDGEGEYTVEGGDRSGDSSGSGTGSGGETFNTADLVYEYVDGDECRICLMDERKGLALAVQTEGKSGEVRLLLRCISRREKPAMDGKKRLDCSFSPLHAPTPALLHRIRVIPTRT